MSRSKCRGDYVSAEQPFSIEPYGDNELYLSMLATLSGVLFRGRPYYAKSLRLRSGTPVGSRGEPEDEPISMMTEDLCRIQSHDAKESTMVRDVTWKRPGRDSFLRHACMVYVEFKGSSANSTTGTLPGAVSVSFL